MDATSAAHITVSDLFEPRTASSGSRPSPRALDREDCANIAERGCDGNHRGSIVPHGSAILVPPATLRLKVRAHGNLAARSSTSLQRVRHPHRGDELKDQSPFRPPPTLQHIRRWPRPPKRPVTIATWPNLRPTATASITVMPRTRKLASACHDPARGRPQPSSTRCPRRRRNASSWRFLAEFAAFEYGRDPGFQAVMYAQRPVPARRRRWSSRVDRWPTRITILGRSTTKSVAR